jgi:protein-disulfide isomerase
VRRNLPFLIIVAVLVVALAGGWLLYRYRMEPEPTPAPAPSPVPTATAPTTTSTPIATTAPAESAVPLASPTPAAPTAGPVFNYGRPGAEPMHIRGDPAAPVVIEEFGDFQCLPCSLMWPILEKLENDYGRQLVIVFREHPLQMHKFAMDAARAAEAAGLQGKFWEMHDALYRNRGTWVPSTYIRPYFNDYAAELKLDPDRFKTDMDGPEVTKRIEADQDRGESLGIDRTPVIFINGQRIAAPDHTDKGMRAAIDKILGVQPQPTK